MSGAGTQNELLVQAVREFFEFAETEEDRKTLAVMVTYLSTAAVNDPFVICVNHVLLKYNEGILKRLPGVSGATTLRALIDHCWEKFGSPSA